MIRKKFVVLEPEEWVRQHCLNYLTKEKNYPISLLNVEKKFKINRLIKRYDVVVYNIDGSIFCLVECKAPSVKITQKTFDQVTQYNRKLNASYLMITNGLNHYYCIVNQMSKNYSFIKSLPNYSINKKPT